MNIHSNQLPFNRSYYYVETASGKSQWEIPVGSQTVPPPYQGDRGYNGGPGGNNSNYNGSGYNQGNNPNCSYDGGYTQGGYNNGGYSQGGYNQGGGYAPQGGYYHSRGYGGGYNQVPQQQQPSYGYQQAQPVIVQQEQPKKSGMGLGAGLAIGAGAGILGGMMLGSALDDDAPEVVENNYYIENNGDGDVDVDF